jgi:hypothetical protein
VLSRIVVARTQRHSESSRSSGGGGLRARMRARAQKNEPLLGITGAPPR